MIAGLSGVIDAKAPDALLVDVGGVIYRVGTSTSTLSSAGDAGDAVKLFTHLVVREDQMALFGFLTQEELAVFETVTGISGIGPRIACAILSTFAPERLHAALEAGDVDLLATVPGVGKKTAARLIVDLRGKIPAGMAGSVDAGPLDQEAMAALRSLGYTHYEAAGAVARLKPEDGVTIEERVVAALRDLSES